MRAVGTDFLHEMLNSDRKVLPLCKEIENRFTKLFERLLSENALTLI